MTKRDIAGIAPFFIVKDVLAALAFYRDRLGFEITFQGPQPEDIFFGIVERGAAMIMLKAVGVDPMPNYTRDVGQGWARWDAYLNVPDPDALAAEYSSRDVAFFEPLDDTDDGLRGFALQDAEDTSCSLAGLARDAVQAPLHHRSQGAMAHVSPNDIDSAAAEADVRPQRHHRLPRDRVSARSSAFAKACFSRGP
jgi:catechol 2,3-dioxygenase-like lactoylglutathione lyase family enzyme